MFVLFAMIVFYCRHLACLLLLPVRTEFPGNVESRNLGRDSISRSDWAYSCRGFAIPAQTGLD